MDGGERTRLKLLSKLAPAQNDDELAQRFFAELTADGKISPEKIAEHQTTFEILARYGDVEKQLAEYVDNAPVDAADKNRFDFLQQQEIAYRQAFELRGGTDELFEDVERELVKGRESDLVVKGLKVLAPRIAGEQFLALKDDDELQEISRLLHKALVYLRSITPNLKVEQVIPLISQADQRVQSTLRFRQGVGVDVPLQEMKGFASVEEAKAARRAIEQAVNVDEDMAEGEMVEDEAEEVTEEVQKKKTDQAAG